MSCRHTAACPWPVGRWLSCTAPWSRREWWPRFSGTTLWRWLSQDSLRPWRHRSWIFPRDSDFAAKAGRILDLYERCWGGTPLGPREYVLCADEKTSIQARRRRHPTQPPAPRRVFWIMDNGSAHRGQPACDRLQASWPNLVLVHTPIHASWLNQIAIYFSIVQGKVLTPNDLPSLAAVKDRLLRFQQHDEQVATPFRWTFTRRHLLALRAKLGPRARRAVA